MDIKKLAGFAAGFVERASAASSWTGKSYACDLGLFFKWAEEKNIGRKTPTPAVMAEFARHLLQERVNFKTKKAGLSASSVNRRLAALSSFFDYLKDMGICRRENPVARCLYLPEPKRLPNPILEADADRLVAQVPHPRDRAMLALFLSGGFRISELIGMDVGDVSVQKAFHEGRWTQLGVCRVCGKGRKERVVFVDEHALSLLAEYLARRVASPESPLLVNEKGVRIATIGAYKRILYWQRKLGVARFNPHRLRHTCATRLLGNGMRIEQLSCLLGHESIATTQLYTLVTAAHVREGYLQAARKSGFPKSSIAEQYPPEECAGRYQRVA